MQAEDNELIENIRKLSNRLTMLLDESRRKCPECLGTGKYLRSVNSSMMKDCPHCDDGFIIDEKIGN